MCLFVYIRVSLVIDRQLVQGEPCFLPNVCWDRLKSLVIMNRISGLENGWRDESGMFPT